MARKIVLRRNRYLDSVFLMAAARRMAAEPGVREASALVGTDANRAVLAELGHAGDPALASAGPGDLVVALEGEPQSIERVAAELDRFLERDAGRAGDGARPRAHTLAEATATRPDATVAVISVPGVHAAREARAALLAGLHVFLFSSNIPVEEELALKEEARRRGLLVMGPDCGTAYLCGAGVGFANAVRRGPVGVVGSTGTGMQELACLLHRAGSGLSHGLGTGSRDLSDAIGGLSTEAALLALEGDAATKVIAVVGKPPGPATAARLLSRLSRTPKPVVLCLLGKTPEDVPPQVKPALTLDEAAALALAATGMPLPAFLHADPDALRQMALAEVEAFRPEQRHIRGLFAGGTLCYQAQVVLRRAGLAVASNAPLPGNPALSDPWHCQGDALVDLGAEVFVEGRPHPMIDGTLRRRRLEEEARDPTVAVLLLDVILGAISSPDPVGELLPAVRAAKEAARARAGHLCVVASICGTEEDAQGLDAQRQALQDAGVRVFESSARAAAFAAEVMRQLSAGREARAWK